MPPLPRTCYLQRCCLSCPPAPAFLPCLHRVYEESVPQPQPRFCLCHLLLCGLGPVPPLTGWWGEGGMTCGQGPAHTGAGGSFALRRPGWWGGLCCRARGGVREQVAFTGSGGAGGSGASLERRGFSSPRPSGPFTAPRVPDLSPHLFRSLLTPLPAELCELLALAFCAILTRSPSPLLTAPHPRLLWKGS